MAKTALVQGRMDPERKRKMEKILNRLGMTHSEAINILYGLIEEYNGLPFPVRIPSEETRKAFERAKKGKDLIEYDDVEDLIHDMEAW